MRQRDKAICLFATDFSETSQVVHFLTREAGIVRLLAKGSKRPKSAAGGMIDLLAEGDLVFIGSKGESLGTLVEFAEADSHAPLRKDARRLHAALYMLELTGEMLGPGDPHPEVFDLLSRALARLGEADAPTAAVLAFFQWRLLRLVGLLGDMDRCVSCGEPPARSGRQDVYFSSREGGLLCGACEAAAAEKYKLDGPALAALAAMRAVESGARAAMPEPQARALSRLLAYHVRQQTGKKLRTERYAIL